MPQAEGWPPGELTDGHNLVLPDSAAAVAAGRHMVATLWRRWGFPPDDLVPILLTSELVTNALRHSFAPRHLWVARLATDHVLVRLSDGSAVPPLARRARSDAVSGRGLLLLDRLADCWGHRPSVSGKIVWFLVAADGSRS